MKIESDESDMPIMTRAFTRNISKIHSDPEKQFLSHFCEDSFLNVGEVDEDKILE